MVSEDHSLIAQSTLKLIKKYLRSRDLENLP